MFPKWYCLQIYLTLWKIYFWPKWSIFVPLLTPAVSFTIFKRISPNKLKPKLFCEKIFFAMTKSWQDTKLYDEKASNWTWANVSHLQFISPQLFSRVPITDKILFRNGRAFRKKGALRKDQSIFKRFHILECWLENGLKYKSLKTCF